MSTNITTILADNTVPAESANAYAMWTMIAEPGDRVAGRLVSALGPINALEAMKDKVSLEELESLVGGNFGIDARELDTSYGRWAPRYSPDMLAVAVNSASRLGAKLITPGDACWPVDLTALGAHAPLALWARGDVSLLHTAKIAVVGARAATGYGEHAAMEITSGLVDHGYTIVSGAAYGIDGMAHRAALAANGNTIAVLPGGVDRFYPSGHDALLQRIVDSGLVVSELPPGAPPTKWRFLQRNRVIAALGAATIVVEAGWRSGSLNAAGHAHALGRPLGAVPGPITSPASAGCHRLLREFSAVAVTGAQDAAELAGGSTISAVDRFTPLATTKQMSDS